MSSTRRTVKSVKEFNEIFKNREIKQNITGFLPECLEFKTRRGEIEAFIEENSIENYLIIDDDKSLNGLEGRIKDNLVLTEYMKGFNVEKLEQAIKIIEKTT